MSIWYKLGEMKDGVSWNIGKAVDAVKDKVEDGIFNTQMKVGTIKDDLLFEAKWKARDVKDFVSEGVSDIAFDLKYDRSNLATNMHQRGSRMTSEKVMNLMFPATGARLSSERLRSLDANLSSKVSELNNLLDEKDSLERKVALEFENGGIIRQNLRMALQQFATEFEKLHNTPEYKLKNIETKLNVELAVKREDGIQFSKLDTALIKIYDDDFNMLSIFKQSPVTSAIIQLREKSLTGEINQCIDEVKGCINKVQVINKELLNLHNLSHSLNNELAKTQVLLKLEIEGFIDVMNHYGTDFDYYDEEAELVVDNVLKMVGLAVRLLNTPIYSKEDRVLNTGFVQQVITNSEKNLEENYGSEVVNSLDEQYEQFTSINFKDGLALVSVQKLDKPRWIRRHYENLLVGYESHFNRGTPTSYSLLSERQSYDRTFADFDQYSLIEETNDDFSRFNESHYKAYINQVKSNHDIFSDFAGRFTLLTKGKTFGYDQYVLYDAKLKRASKLDLNMHEYNMFSPSFNLISAVIYPFNENSAEIVLIGYMTAREYQVLQVSYFYQNESIYESGGKLKFAFDLVNQELKDDHAIVNVIPGETLDSYLFLAVEKSFIENPYQVQRKNTVNIYSVIDGKAKLLASPREQMYDKVNVNAYLNSFAFNIDDHQESNNSDNYLHRFLGFGLRNKVAVTGNRMFILDYYSESGSYQLDRGDWENHDLVRCQQRILEFDLKSDILIATHEIGIDNPNVHEVLYHNNRLYAIDMTHGLLVYTV